MPPPRASILCALICVLGLSASSSASLISAATGPCQTNGDCVCSSNFDSTCSSSSGNYNDDESCSISFTQEVQIAVDHFEIEGSATCSFDYLQTSDGTKYCGSLSGSAVTVSGPGAPGTSDLTWSTDGASTDTGFKICATPSGGSGDSSGGGGSGSSGTGSSGSTTTTTTTTTTSSSSSSSNSAGFGSSSGNDDCDEGGSPAVVIQALLCGTAGILGVFLAVVLVLPDKSRSNPPKEDAGSAGAITMRTSAIDQKGGTQGWGPWGWLFPRVWVKVWFGYLAMLLLLSAMAMIPSAPGVGDLLTGDGCTFWFIDLLMSFGPFIHCGLMPLIWVHKHREVKKMMEGPAVELEATELDPESKTVIFAVKGGIKVLLADIFCGTVSKVLNWVRRASLGTIDLRALWFPAPFYSFYKAKMLVRNTQIDGCRICITATQADAYMKFCTETMLNFWTLGWYGRCCSKRTNYGRFLDRHIMWQGKPPPGYNNQFRIFDEKFTMCQKFKIFMLRLLLSLLSFVPFVNQILPWYNYKTRLSNMKFGGSDPFFAKEFTVVQYVSKYCTVGACGCCATALKRWVDTNIRMGEPKFDEEMAEEDAAADAANPEEMERTPSFLPQSSSIEGAAVAPMHELKVVTIAPVPSMAQPAVSSSPEPPMADLTRSSSLVKAIKEDALGSKDAPGRSSRRVSHPKSQQAEDAVAPDDAGTKQLVSEAV